MMSYTVTLWLFFTSNIQTIVVVVFIIITNAALAKFPRNCYNFNARNVIYMYASNFDILTTTTEEANILMRNNTERYQA